MSARDEIDRGSVVVPLPRPTAHYVSMVVIAVVVVIAVWGMVADPGNAPVIASGVLAGVLVCWVVLVRPRVQAYANGLQLTNMIRDVFVPWERIERVRVLQVLQVVTDEGRFSCAAVSRSAREQIRGDQRFAGRPNAASMLLGNSMASRFGLNAQTERRPSVQLRIEQLVAREAEERSRRHRYEGAADRPIVRHWAADGIGALLLAVACLMIVFAV